MASTQEERMYKHLLVPTDGSALSNTALEKAIEFARQVTAKVTILTVTEPFKLLTADPEQLESTHDEFDRHAEKVADQLLGKARQAAASAGVTCDTVTIRSGDPARAIVETATERGCDLIAMGSHGREGFKAFMIGSVTMKVLAHTNLPVLVYR
jgi:nucleotide-binding universal stress UspA family protein